MLDRRRETVRMSTGKFSDDRRAEGEGAAPWAVIGGGNMAGAIIRGGLEGGRLKAERVVVAEPDAGKRAAFAAWGVGVCASAAEAMARLGELEAGSGRGQVLIAVKPQVFAEVAGAIGAAEGAARGEGRRVVVSIMAGVTTEGIMARLQGAGAGAGKLSVVRLMPNLPVAVGLGCTAMCLGAGAGAGDEDEAEALFSVFSRVVRLEEGRFDAFTAVAGSGPAYAFYLAEGMARGAAAAELGLDERGTREVIAAVLRGAAEMLVREPEAAAAELRARVTSKGGTTAAATAVLDAAGVLKALERAVVAARDRGRELGR